VCTLTKIPLPALAIEVRLAIAAVASRKEKIVLRAVPPLSFFDVDSNQVCPGHGDKTGENRGGKWGYRCVLRGSIEVSVEESKRWVYK
jgi:hypothetical protein